MEKKKSSVLSILFSALVAIVLFTLSSVVIHVLDHGSTLNNVHILVKIELYAIIYSIAIIGFCFSSAKIIITLHPNYGLKIFNILFAIIFFAMVVATIYSSIGVFFVTTLIFALLGLWIGNVMIKKHTKNS